MIRYRNMHRAELDTVLDWAAEEGWNPGLDDAAAFWAADADGFFVADAGSGPVAAISVVRHTEHFAFLGFYICRPEYRGRGIGIELWRHALAHAGDRVVGLDGVPEQQQNYERSGFIRAGETVRHVGRMTSAWSTGIRRANVNDIDALIALEAKASGIAKPAYLAAWFEGSPTRRTLIEEEAGKLTGSVTIRRCRSGAKVGPVLARDTQTAVKLVRAAATIFEGAISIDVPQSAEGFCTALRSEGFIQTFRTARMYTRLPSDEGRRVPAIFSVTSLELG